MNDRGKSDELVVPTKRANKGDGAPLPAESVEGRGSAKGNQVEQNRFRTLSRSDLQIALHRVRQAAKKDKRVRFTALWHHVCNVEHLREAYMDLKRNAAPGVDGQTWQQYGEDLEGNLKDLAKRLQRGAYRVKAVRRVYIPKPDGRQRPIGVTTLEDKIVQRATVEVLNAVYETDFKGFSYGFRPKRGAHNALDALTVGIEKRKVNWVLDADIRGFFDTIDHEWLMKFVEHRIADRRVVRHIKKWLKAGVLEDGTWRETDEGTPQGGSISPLLANIYLHYVFDLWADRWRRKEGTGDIIIVRYADDFVVGFQHRRDAERFQSELRERFRKFNLELHEDKTRLIEFGRYADTNRRKQGLGLPETFGFLGFTHICGRTRKGGFCVLRQTMRKRLQAKLRQVKTELRRRMHDPVRAVGKWLGSVVTGHYRYYGVPRNHAALGSFHKAIVRLWYNVLRRRSQKTRMTWARLCRWVRLWIPYPRILHPYPDQRLRV